MIIRTLKAVESRFWLLALLFTVFQMVLVSTSAKTLHQEGRVFILEVKKILFSVFSNFTSKLNNIIFIYLNYIYIYMV